MIKIAMKYGYIKIKSLQAVITEQLSIVLVSASLMIFISTTQLSAYSIHLKPTDQVNPSQSSPILDKVPESSKISTVSEQKEEDDSSVIIKDRSWWSWLTNSSSKPAYFHYVDFIELLS